MLGIFDSLGQVRHFVLKFLILTHFHVIATTISA